MASKKKPVVATPVDFQPVKEEQVQLIAIAEIKSNAPNHRESAGGLLEHGYGLFTKREDSDKAAVVPLALGSDDDKKEFVKVIDNLEKPIAEFAGSLGRFGQLAPVIVRTLKDGGYEVVAGMRRVLSTLYNHAKHGAPATVGCVVRELNDEAAELVAFEENFRRKELSVMEQAHWYDKLVKRGIPIKEISERSGVDHQTIRGRMKLLGLSEEKQALVHSGEMPYVKALHIVQGKSNPSDPRATSRGGKGGKATGNKSGARRSVPTLAEFQKMYEEREGMHEKVREFIAVDILGVEYRSFAVLQKMKADIAAKEAKDKEDKKKAKAS